LAGVHRQVGLAARHVLRARQRIPEVRVQPDAPQVRHVPAPCLKLHPAFPPSRPPSPRARRSPCHGASWVAPPPGHYRYGLPACRSAGLRAPAVDSDGGPLLACRTSPRPREQSPSREITVKKTKIFYLI